MTVFQRCLLGAAGLLLLGGCDSILGLDRHYNELDCPSADSCPDATTEAGSDAPTDGQRDGGDASMGHETGTPDTGALETGALDTGTEPDAEGGTGEGGPSEEAGCPTGSLACDGGCVPNDPRNCGACGHDCTTLPNVSGQVQCGPNGTCEFDAGACASGYAHCDGGANAGCETPVDTQSSCGACGAACTGNTPKCAASGGTYSCVSGCTAPSPTPCGSTCVDTNTDKNNCGSCNNACTTTISHATPTCSAGMCSYACNSGYTMCGGGCVDYSSDPANCGGCGNACGALQICSGGHCTCEPGALSCPGGCALPSPSNGCGGSTTCTGCPGPTAGTGQATCTGTACAIGCASPTTTQCGTACVNTSSDSNNCGTCTHACTNGEQCLSGGCACASGTLGDSNNCGTCGHQCTSGEQCNGGGCACVSGTLGDDNNCGSCGVVCNSGEHCNGSSCACASGTLGDNFNCGTCGHACGANLRCVSGSCMCDTTSCPTGCCASSTGPCGNSQTACGPTCANCNTLPPNATNSTCNNGQCQITACAFYMTFSHGAHGCGPTGTENYSDCDGVWSNGCETLANSNSNCGACGYACPAGQTCSNATNYTPEEVPACEDPTTRNPSSSPQCGGAYFCGISNGC